MSLAIIRIENFVADLMALNCPIKTLKGLLPFLETFQLKDSVSRKLHRETLITLNFVITTMEGHRAFCTMTRTLVSPILQNGCKAEVNKVMTSVGSYSAADNLKFNDYKLEFVITLK